jgi:hypothetical protein
MDFFLIRLQRSKNIAIKNKSFAKIHYMNYRKYNSWFSAHAAY